MDKRRQIKISKFLSYVLRHHPGSIGIELDEHGWAYVSELLKGAEQNGFIIKPDDLNTVVEKNDKQRFSLSEDGLRIRAKYGHSIAVDLGYSPILPPEILYHGTAKRNLESIRTNGLTKGSRYYVHLSPDNETAISVGQRHGKPVVLEVEAGRMYSDGYKFCFCPESKVWLTDGVPVEYIRFPKA